MSPQQDDAPTDGFRLGDVASMLDLKESTILYWLSNVEGVAAHLSDSPKDRRRFYTEHDIDLLRWVRDQRNAGLSIPAIERLIEEGALGDPATAMPNNERASVLRELTQIRDELATILTNLDQPPTEDAPQSEEYPKTHPQP